MLLTEFVDIKMSPYVLNYYRSLGYNIRLWNIVNVPVSILTDGCTSIIEFSCDYCGKTFARQYNDYLKCENRSPIKKDCWYWHDEIKDKKRDELIKSLGWKILRIKSGTKIPDIKILVEKIFSLYRSNDSYDEIILPDWKNKNMLEMEG